MWISREKYDALQLELAGLRAKVMVYEMLAKQPEPPPAAPKPEVETLKPIDRDKAAKLNGLLKGETPWKKYKREAEKTIREQPKETVVNTPATQ